MEDFIAGRTLANPKVWSLGRRSKLHRIDKEDVWTYVVASEVVNIGLGQHGVVFQLGLAERRCVPGDDDELGLSGSEGLESRFVSESDCEGGG
jgi:hypothetical protein